MLTFGQMEETVEAIGQVDNAEKEETPLGSMMGRILESGFGNGDDIAEYAGRQCYRSFDKGRSPEDYINNILEQGHGSVLEHASIVFQIAGVSRNLTHELIRHRVGTAYSQESQRYVDAREMRFVIPPLLLQMLGEDLSPEALFSNSNFIEFHDSCEAALRAYVRAQARYEIYLKGLGFKGHELKKRVNEAARSELPGASETRLVFTVNMRELRHILTLRGGVAADLEIRRFAFELLPHAKTYAPLIFADMAHRADELGLAPVVERLMSA